MEPWNSGHWLPGVLSINQIEALQNEGYIQNFKIPSKDKHESSIDLQLSSECYELIKGSIKPHGKEFYYYKLLHDNNYAKKIESENGIFKLKAEHCYLFKLNERLTPKFANKNFYGQATAKSSIGRLDVIARLIVDAEHQYDCFNSENIAYSSGDLFLEIIPISFNIKVKEGLSLSQLRFFYGKIEDSEITDSNFINGILEGTKYGVGYLSVDTTKINIGGLDVTAFCARKDDNKDKDIDLTIDTSESNIENLYYPYDFWNFVKSDEFDRLQIVFDKFYIIRSKERISMPPGVAVYCKAIDESLGEMRIHYAGFVHPYFGLDRKDEKKGTPLIFEVRGHNVNVSLADGERLAKLIFYRMSDVVKKEQEKNSTYQEDNIKENTIYNEQELTLSKFFKEWTNKLEYVNEENGIVKPKELEK